MPYTQGTLTSVAFDTTTAAFDAVFTYRASTEGETVIYLNQDYWYGDAEPTVSFIVNSE